MKVISSSANAYRGVWRILRRYWSAYGGFPALIASPYFHLSLVLTAATFPKWSAPGWWDTVISVMPSIVGFSLGGYAIWLAFGEERFKALLGHREPGQTTSPYMAVNAAFVHFILMQIAALLFALLVNAHTFEVCSDSVLGELLKRIGISHSAGTRLFQLVSGMVGYWLFLYALVTAIAATFAVLRVASWYDEYLAVQAKDEAGQSKANNASKKTNNE